MGIAVWRFVGWGIWLCEFFELGQEGREGGAEDEG